MNEDLLFLGKTLEAIQRMRVAAQVRITHLAKNKKKCKLTELVRDQEEILEEMLNGELRSRMLEHPAHEWFYSVKGIGLINIGKVISFIDIEEATNISKLWRYAGFACDESGQAERRRKGEKPHFNGQLKSLCWRLGKSLIRAKGKYYDFYLKEKKRIGKREAAKGREVIPSAKLPKEKGKHVETDEFFALGHVDMMAMRKMIKLFLSHLWLVWREADGLAVTKPYIHEIAGHSNYIDPYDMIEES